MTRLRHLCALAVLPWATAGAVALLWLRLGGGGEGTLGDDLRTLFLAPGALVPAGVGVVALAADLVLTSGRSSLSRRFLADRDSSLRSAAALGFTLLAVATVTGIGAVLAGMDGFAAAALLLVFSGYLVMIFPSAFWFWGPVAIDRRRRRRAGSGDVVAS